MEAGKKKMQSSHLKFRKKKETPAVIDLTDKFNQE
jgi:hypothetical protein